MQIDIEYTVCDETKREKGSKEKEIDRKDEPKEYTKSKRFTDRTKRNLRKLKCCP